MNRILVAKMTAPTLTWKKEEPFENRKIRTAEIDIYYVNDANYLVENIFYIDKETATHQVMGQPEIRQINTFQNALEVMNFMQRRNQGEAEFCYQQGIVYKVIYNYDAHFHQKMGENLGF